MKVFSRRLALAAVLSVAFLSLSGDAGAQPPPTPFVTISVPMNPAANANFIVGGNYSPILGTVTITATKGGVSWSPVPTHFFGSYTATLNLPAGTYTVTVVLDGTAASDSKMVTVGP